LAALERLGRLSHGSTAKGVDRDAGRLQDTEGIGAHAAGDYGLGALLRNELSGLNARPAGGADGGVLHRLICHALGIDEDVGPAATKDGASRGVEIQATAGDGDSHLQPS
jgi:hypothetical protein